MEFQKSRSIATGTSPDIVRLMRAMGISNDHVTAFSLSCAGPGEIIEVSMTRYLTETEVTALAAELEASPLVLGEAKSAEGASDQVSECICEIKALREELRRAQEVDGSVCQRVI